MTLPVTIFAASDVFILDAVAADIYDAHLELGRRMA